MRLWGLVLRRSSRLSDCRTRTMHPRGCLLGQNSRRLAVSDGSADRCDSELFPCSLTPNREGPPSLIQETAVKVNAPVFQYYLAGTCNGTRMGSGFGKAVSWRM